MDKLSQEANRRVQNEASKQQANDLGDYDKQKEKLMAEITELRKNLDTTVTTNRESELQLRKVKPTIIFTIYNLYHLFGLYRKLLREKLKWKIGYNDMIQRWVKNRFVSTSI